MPDVRPSASADHPAGDAVKSALRRLRNQASKPPIQLGDGRRYNRGLIYNLGAGRTDRETFLRQYGLSGTLYGIVSLLAESAATPAWHLYKKPPLDGRRRYSTADQGSDQRIEVVQHAAIQLWNNPNDWHSGFEFREAAQQHEELSGETIWVLDMEAGFPTSMWHVRPDRMEPVPDPDNYLAGWIYTGPTGEQVPLKPNEVILEKRPDPLDPYRGAGPVASIMPNVQQQRYATEYQRNLFLNGANPGGVITVPNHLTDEEFDQLIDRWRETHRGVARAGHVGVLEDGMTWTADAHTNRDMEYANLRLNNRDELREAWRIHKAMMGTSDDVNRANAQTAQEVFVAWQVIPRLNRRRDTLNSKLLPLFGATAKAVEFDYEDPSPVNAETAANEMLQKAQAAQALLATNMFDPHDVLETVGLPDMETIAAAVAPPPVPAKPAVPALPEAQPQDRERIVIRNAAASPDLAAVDEQWRDATAQLAAQYQQQVVPAQREQAAGQIRDILTAGTVAALASLSLSSAVGAAVILAAMTAYAQTAAAQAAIELRAPNAPTPAPVMPSSQHLQQVADVTAALLASELALAAGREALRLSGTGASPRQVADDVTRYLQSLSPASLTAHLSGAMSAAQNAARLATFTAPAAPRSLLTATEVHDKNTCGPCGEIDGTEFGYSDDPAAVAAAHAAYPVGGYVGCQGKDRCRGTLHAVLAPAPVRAAAPLPVITLPPAAGFKPAADLMRHALTGPLNGHSQGARR